jgi:serralysin
MSERLLRHLWSALAVCAVVAANARAYDAVDRWAVTATDGSTGNPGTPITVTWSLAPDGTTLPTATSSSLISFLDGLFGAGPGGANYALRPWFTLFEQSFTRLGELAGVTYVYESHDDGIFPLPGRSFSNALAAGVLGVRGDVRIGGKAFTSPDENALAVNFFPDYGEMMFNVNQGGFLSNSTNDFRAFRNTVMHEAMHGLGAGHVVSTGSRFLIEPTLGTVFEGPQLDDILVLQKLYGDVLEKNTGNDSYLSATSLGAVSIAQGQMRGTLGDSTVVDKTETDFLSIDNASDEDYFSFTIADALEVTLDVTPKGAAYSIRKEIESSEYPYNSRLLNDLSLTLFDSTGAAQIGAIANSTGLGGSENIVRNLAPGTYFARVSGVFNDVQLYQISVAAAPPGPDDLVWLGDLGSAWDFGTANFFNGQGVDVFADGDNVLFTDAVATTAVLVTTNMAPGAVTIDAATNYSFAGAGGITAESLTVSGGGTTELANPGNQLGAIDVSAGGLRISGQGNAPLAGGVRVAAGATLELVGAQQFAATGRLSGGGTIIGDVAMPGIIAPGDAAGTLTLADDLELASTSVLEIEIGGELAGWQHDLLSVTGLANLDGGLLVTLIDGFTPTAGNGFTIVTGGQLVGAFDELQLPGLSPGLAWHAEYSSSELVLSVSSAVLFDPADFNEDGQVDADDLGAWHAGYGLQGSAMHGDGDANGDLIVDGADLLIWQRNLGSGPGVGASNREVPEPAAGALLLAGLAAGLAPVRRARMR